MRCYPNALTRGTFRDRTPMFQRFTAARLQCERSSFLGIWWGRSAASCGAHCGAVAVSVSSFGAGHAGIHAGTRVRSLVCHGGGCRSVPPTALQVGVTPHSIVPMTVRQILRLGDPRLRSKAEPVPELLLESEGASVSVGVVNELRQLVDDLIETMRAANGAGIAAPQVGVSLQVCVIEVNRNERYPLFPEIPLTVLINPLLTPLSQTYDVLAPEDAISVYEGCLSVPGLRGRVSRPRRVRVQAKDLNGRKIDEVWEGAKAAVVQHEVDHLHGTLFVDRADTSTLCFMDEYERFVPFADRVVDGVA